jgi:quercetin dioxygenase-like cupin family protein
MITSLPRVDVPLDGATGYLVQGPTRQAVFFDLEPMELPEHTHGAQYGVVIEGRMTLTVAGEGRDLGPGDSYFIPAGTPHSAVFHTKVRVLDVFEDKDRYGVAS